VAATLAVPSRSGAIERARERGLAVVAALPYHYPRALLRAHRCHTVEVWAPAVAVDSGARHFQAYTCGLVTRGTAFLLDGGLDSVDAVLVPHGCDALQGMGSVLTDFVADRPPVLTFYPPRGRRDVDRDYLVAELRALADRLADVTGHRPDADDWQEALALEEAADAALADLYAHRTELALTDREFYTLVRAREYLLAEDMVEATTVVPRGPARQRGVGLVLSGILAEPLELFDRIDEAGAHVAADDLSTGTRRLLPPAATAAPADPYERLADRLMSGPPDPTRTDPVTARAAHLIGLLQRSGAAGVLAYDPTFCEPELFYLPLLREHLAAAGYPLLHVEVEPGTPLPTQTVTRIEAFVETLS